MKTLVKMQFGSHVYGTNLPTSDLDYKAIHVPDSDDILLQRAKQSINNSRPKGAGERNTASDVDFESFSLQKFMNMLLEGQTVAVSMLFTPEKWWSDYCPEWQFILANKDQWLHKKVQAFAGYCRQQANKYGIKGSRMAAARKAVEFFDRWIVQTSTTTKLSEIWLAIEEEFRGVEHCEFITDAYNQTMLSVCDRKVHKSIPLKEAYKIYKHIFDEYGLRARQAESNENVDWKAMMHATRVSYEAEELLTTSFITYPRPEAELLLKIRKGELPYKDVAEMLELRLELLERAAKNSSLPEEGNKKLAENFTLQVYRNSL